MEEKDIITPELEQDTELEALFSEADDYMQRNSLEQKLQSEETKKFNYIYNENVDRPLSKKAASLGGDRWIVLVSIIESINDNIKDATLCRELKETSILKLFEADQSGSEMYSLINTDVESFIDEIIYERYIFSRQQGILRLALVPVMGLFLTLLMALPQLLYGLTSGIWIDADSFEAVFYMYDMAPFLAVMLIFFPPLNHFKMWLKSKTGFAYGLILLIINLAIAAAVSVPLYLLELEKHYIFTVDLWIYVLVFVVLGFTASYIVKRIN